MWTLIKEQDQLGRQRSGGQKDQGQTQGTLEEKCNFHPTFISLVERKQLNVTISTLEINTQTLVICLTIPIRCLVMTPLYITSKYLNSF
jgi:hypothetical protein